MTTTGSILLVDDEEKILKTLGRALRDEGHRVVERGDAREARELIADGGVDVLVVDNLMPGLTGLELIRDIVATVPESDRPQIVMMTAHATVADAIEAMKLGALDFLQKPFEIEHLLVTVSRARSSTSGCARSTAICSASATKSSTTTASSGAAG